MNPCNPLFQSDRRNFFKKAVFLSATGVAVFTAEVSYGRCGRIKRWPSAGPGVPADPSHPQIL